VNDLALIPELVTSGWFVTNVLPYWVAFVVGCILIGRLSR
jgi:hypothetical protein